jgi:hypothetical protein
MGRMIVPACCWTGRLDTESWFDVQEGTAAVVVVAGTVTGGAVAGGAVVVGGAVVDVVVELVDVDVDGGAADVVGALVDWALHPAATTPAAARREAAASPVTLGFRGIPEIMPPLTGRPTALDPGPSAGGAARTGPSGRTPAC